MNIIDEIEQEQMKEITRKKRWSLNLRLAGDT